MGAGDWIKMRVNLEDDPRVHGIADIVGAKDVDLIIGKLYRLWKYGDQHTEDGRIPLATPGTIDRMLRMRGLARALTRVGWLEFDDDGAIIPRFHEHNGESAKRRAKDAQRKAQSRSGFTSPQNVHGSSARRPQSRGHDADKDRTHCGTFAELEKNREERIPLTPFSEKADHDPTAPDSEAERQAAEDLRNASLGTSIVGGKIVAHGSQPERVARFQEIWREQTGGDARPGTIHEFVLPIADEVGDDECASRLRAFSAQLSAKDLLYNPLKKFPDCHGAFAERRAPTSRSEIVDVAKRNRELEAKAKAEWEKHDREEALRAGGQP